jgi:DnaJ-class molecular chaperone
MGSNYGNDDLSEMLRRAFGGFGMPRRGFPGFSMPITLRLEVKLEDMYNGRTLSVEIYQANLKIVIEKGMQDGTEMLVREAFNDGKGSNRDGIIRIKQAEHNLFARKNADLLMKLTISLEEALFGFNKTFTHLDGKIHELRSKRNEIIDFGTVFLVKDMGMPIYKSVEYGDLYVVIEIEMPKKLNLKENSLTQFKKLLRLGLKEGSDHSNEVDDGHSILNPVMETDSQSQNISINNEKINLKSKLLFKSHKLVKGDIRYYGQSGMREYEEDDDNFFGGSSFFRF